MDTESKIRHLQEEIVMIKKRNVRVESEKAWEKSWIRRGLICLFTYIVVVLFFRSIGTSDYFINAFIPVIGYILSTLSIPVIKKWWITKKFNIKETV